MMKKKEKTEIKHWAPYEILAYYFFLIYKAEDLLTSDVKSCGFYVQMSKYLFTRGKVQCRSHHQKMLLKEGKFVNPDKRTVELRNLNQFFQDNYALRMLDSSHLMMEIDHQLAYKLRKGIITKTLFHKYRISAEANLEILNFSEEADSDENSDSDDGPKMDESEEEPLSQEQIVKKYEGVCEITWVNTIKEGSQSPAAEVIIGVPEVPPL